MRRATLLILVLGVVAAGIWAILQYGFGSGGAPPVETTRVGMRGGRANIFVSANGSDSCTRVSSPVEYVDAAGHVCATPLAACRIAQPGDVVILEDGTYSGDMQTCVGHETAARNIVFEPEPGHECRMTYPNVPRPWSDTSCSVNLTGNQQEGLSLGGTVGQSCGVTGHPLPSTLSDQQRAGWNNHLTFKGLYLGNMSAICASFIQLDHDAGNHFYVGEGAYHFYVVGGDYGNRSDGEQPTIGDTVCGCNNWPPAENVRIVGAVIHDFISQGESHGDGIFVDPSYDVQILENVLARDDCIPIYVNFATGFGQPVGVHGLRIIGNVVHSDTIHNGGSRCYQGISLGSNEQADTIVAFNSVEGPIRRSGVDDTRADQIVGNVASGITNSSGWYGCESGVSTAYNLLFDARADDCGHRSNVLTGGRIPYVSTDAQPNSPPGTDKYFAPPLGNYALAATGTTVARVPVSWCTANPGVCPKTDVLGNPRPNPAHPAFYDAGAYENR